MPTTLSQRDLRALADGEPAGVRALSSAMEMNGWPTGLQELRTHRLGALWELSAAAEPAAVIGFTGSRLPERLTSVAYTRQARYAVSWSPSQVALFDSLRWNAAPGDAPAAVAEATDVQAVEQLLALLGRDEVLGEVPSDLLLRTPEHRALPQLLGDALAQLRLDVANSEAYGGRDPTGQDTAVLRLFHQILYVRIAEDRRRPQSHLAMRAILGSEQLNTDLASLLNDYRSTANSELFQPAGVSIEDLPADSLRAVLRQTVEPWERLRLDFSVARHDLAGRLYESYLSTLPTEDASQRLFPVARGVDRREQHATFYTPPALAQLLTDQALLRWIEDRGIRQPSEIKVVDPACGSGAFLVAAYDCLRQYFEAQRDRPLRPREREEILLECIFGADVDERALGLAQVQLLEIADLHGRLPSMKQNLLRGDSLPAPPGVSAAAGQVQWDKVIRERGEFTTVLGNPPFGAQAKLPGRLSVEAISQLRDRYPEVRSFGQDYAYFFLALANRLLTPDGSAGLVMPRGLIALGQGAAARAFLSDLGISWIADLRAARVFSGVGASVAAVAVDKSEPSSARVESVRDSRGDPRTLLDDLANNAPDTVATASVDALNLRHLAGSGWTLFRLRWADSLRSEIGRPFEPLANGHASSGRRVVRTGVKTARVADFIIAPDCYRSEPDNMIAVGSRVIPDRFLPRVVYASDIEPFDLQDSGRRLFLPFEIDGTHAKDPEVEAALADRGGLPAHYQHGDLSTLLGPKVLLKAFAREPATVADTEGRYVPVMRGVHAIGFSGIAVGHLSGLATLLNSALYQWLLQGLGSPRADETIEVTVDDVGSLPFPDLTHSELRQLDVHAKAVITALEEEDPIRRAHAVRDARADADRFVFELLKVSAHLEDTVRNELVRVA
jgi:hypothetical protein